MSHRNNAMPEPNDPAIKLFGRSIALPDSQFSPEYHDSGASQLMAAPPPTSDSMCQDTSPEAIKRAEEPCNIEDSDNEDENSTSEGLESAMSGEQQNTEADNKNPEASKAATLKKPDKILPCPRCNSMETKFCYFNNYNVNQPRHFCRSCQRYWTAGGAIRNVPVGAGRRKNKHASSQLQPVVIPSNGGSFTPVNLINPDSPLCLVANKLSLEEPEHCLEASNVAAGGATTGLPSSNCSSMRENKVSHEVPQTEKVGSSDGGFTPLHTFQGFPGPPPYPWNLSWNAMAYGGGTGNAFLVPWNSPTMTINPGLCMPNVTFPFVPPMCWSWDATTGNLSSNNSLSPASCSGNSSCSGNTSPLGKHSRDLDSQDEEKAEKSLWIPKTLRIDDPEEAAKSSIWTTLGIKPGEPGSKGGMFKPLKPRMEGNAETSEADKALQANPAAFSRSQAFQEST